MVTTAISPTSHNTAFEIGYGRVLITGKQQEELLLGQTKYYAAVWDDPSRKQNIVIKPVATDSHGEPDPPSNLVDGAFEDDPIKVLGGGKSGVYWERQWASINSDGSISTGPLPSGMIRLVGRYWEAGKEYKVKLKANSGGKSGELEIEVVKPDRLGDKYGKARDVFDKVVDVDSLIIANAGKYGIPPQLIKAHISVEAAKKNFGGEIGSGFAPSYLYEPYTVQFWDLRNLSERFFIQDSSSTYFSDVPDHKHVLFKDYYRKAKSVWDIVKENSQLVDVKVMNTYGKRESDGKMNFVAKGYITMQEVYNEKYDSLSLAVQVDSTSQLTNSQIADSTNRIMIEFLRDKWKGGLKNHIAQTRAASSYGLLQMLYVRAREEVKYDIKKLPENMNTNSFFVESVMHQKAKLNEHLNHLGDELNSNWSDGYEGAFRNSIFDTWNPKAGYPEKILTRVKNYLPAK